MSEQDPIAILQNIYQAIEKLNAKIDILDMNVKLLNSKSNSEMMTEVQKLMNERMKQRKPAKPDPSLIPQITPQEHRVVVEQPPMKAVVVSAEPASELKAVYQLTKVSNTVLSDDGEPIVAAKVKIMNESRKVIKEITTNRAGLWIASLRSGKYFAKIVSEGRPTQFKVFEVPTGKEELVI